MKLVVALGNIGREYAGTRHNIGFMTADLLAERWGDTEAWRKADNAFYLEKRMPEKCWVIKPTTYMNNSGVAVADFANFYHIPPEDVLVIQDDMDLPVGTLRIRRKGSSGGHNGLKSIERALGSQAYPRIKVGIGHPVHQEQAVISHVLHPFQGEDKEKVQEALDQAADAVEAWMKGAAVGELMQQFNKKAPKKPKTEKVPSEEAKENAQ
ncbi:aminoacyl-tRNA hydrolase [Acidaminococcus fermentans]|uniref:aminoacyl-tRNA hydrolase n=1 Tax=Acidaminococcus fermentans TaxID=905 RepID=UPI0008E87926|nr:aminoacyl-tRNA hydrolase [Acidaminococcus fermentans]MCI6286445.1 aminoacyl-tRNA hydrolase [Acidaminococcus fermentans]MCI7194533.1 aminoacyl-tRNA hydrolase [Acidaminococcus fermentans]MDY2852243.1 aminoacyl-tRNA hydrolase [Acidaminococcus fermentans]MEE0338279.1 aminoacyl-tRNA hydrolase [Acidaminococcus fermentans]SFO72139.1 peptidyl-tRNA hydrolase, PTH1 family [Acidaminococcus fermentans]